MKILLLLALFAADPFDEAEEIQAGRAILSIVQHAQHPTKASPAATPATVAPAIRRYVLMFSAAWCSPCRQWKAGPAKALGMTNWKIGTPDGHVVIVDADAAPEILDKWRVNELPTFVLIESGPNGETELGRHVGYMDQWQFGRFFAGQPAAATPAPPAPAPAAAAVLQQPTQFPFRFLRRRHR
jgi:hypothetical protein